MSLLKRLLAAALCILTVISLCGCEFNSNENKIISMGVDKPPVNIDPQLASSDSELIIARNTMTGLFRINADGNVEQSLCDSWSVSSDELTYEFKLKDAKWSNDEKITADDFVFGIVRALSADTKSPYANTLFCIKNAAKFNSGEVNEAQLGVSAVDSKTIKIVLEKKISDLFYRLADTVSMPCNRTFFNECKGKYGLSDDDMIYCGPFYLSNWTNKIIKMSRNSDYVGQRAKPASVTMTFGETSDEKIFSITKGVIDIAVIGANKEMDAKNAGLNTSSLQRTVWSIIINPNAPICGTKLGSSALVKSLDRTAIEKALPSGYSMFSGLIAPDINVCGEKYVNYINEYTQQPMNADEAKQEYMQALKENSGSMNGTTLLYVKDEQMDSLAVKIAASWQSNLDAYINTEGVSFNEMQKRIASGNYTVVLYPIGYGTLDAESTLNQFITGNSANIFGISDTEFDRLMINAEKAVSAVDKSAALNKAEKQLISSGYVCPMILSPTVVACTPSMSGCIFDLFRGNFDFSNTGK